MKTIFDHIDRVKAQPHHIRKQVAFTSAAIGTAVIALVWFVGSLTTGAFSINGNPSASAKQANTVSADANQNLAGIGAAGVLPQSSNVPAHIEIIDANPSGAVQKKAEQTTIPF